MDVMARIAAEQLAHERRVQCGVVSYEQLIAGGWDWPRIRRSVRRRELVRVHPRVYVDHTGPLTPEQRAWAAVLYARPAALCLAWATGRPTAGEVHVAVGRGRRLDAPEGVVIHEVAEVAQMIRANTSPPRLALEHNVLLAVGLAADESAAIGLLSEQVGRNGVTASSVRRALQLHRKVRFRALLQRLLDDIENGTESVLEHGYLTRVERPHGLPVPTRQARRGTERRDMLYAELALVVELDSRLHDTWAAGNNDARRDLADIQSGRTVLRLRWQQVMVESCATAAAIVTILVARGWSGRAVACSPGCPVSDVPSVTVIS
jgi:very-short-patch-repair endonuclease